MRVCELTFQKNEHGELCIEARNPRDVPEEVLLKSLQEASALRRAALRNNRKLAQAFLSEEPCVCG